ncbi:NitT/TauT family transport system substrate-binding protein [Georgenia soli]|uniref:Thiamine pyrimidine synthase n=1 Tax=Georgenia soli TaxID=638953 RepID=A0A2A9F1C6_9MICO|nr:ABC transporter substrate-binding protein [Georgenia soli]PFG45114.1 NitT/TauT family transport system substrate-binding protein [Georgenia soli]
MNVQNRKAGFSRRGFLQAGGLLGGAFLLGTTVACSSDPSSTSPGATDPNSSDSQQLKAIDLQLSWLGNAQVLGDAVALKKGFYAENGLKVTMKEGGPNADPPGLIASGSSPAGYVSSSPLHMTAVSAGVSVKAYGVNLQQHPWAFISMKDNPIRTPEDLIGKRIGTQPTGGVLVDAVLAKHGISRDQIEIVGVGSDTAPLASGQVDAWTGWTVNYGQLQPLGNNYETMRIWDIGIQLYAGVLLANASVVEEDPEMLAGILSATAKGWRYARDNHDEAIEILKETFPNIDPKIESESAKLVMDIVFTDETEENGWGQMARDNWENQIRIYDELGQFEKGAPNVDDVMTLEILERTVEERSTSA